MARILKLAHFAAFLSMLSPIAALAAPITYYDLDFEDGTAGGGTINFGTPANIPSGNLDGRSMLFGRGDQMRWSRNGDDSLTHYVAFDYYAEAGANITQFLDVQSILRLDVSEAGRHHIDVYYDLGTEQAWSYIDGTQDLSLLTILAWPVSPMGASDIRIANQTSPPGNSDGIFEIDNLLWQGNIDVFTPGLQAGSEVVPVPGALLLAGLGAGLVTCIRRRGTL